MLDMSTPIFSRDSLKCVSTVRNKILLSSRDVGWTSVLLDHLEGHGESGVYDKPTTCDVCLVVAASGEHELSVFKNGRWHDTVSQVGSLSLTRSGESNRLRWRTRNPTPFTTISLYIPQKFMFEASEHFSRAGQPLRDEPVPTHSLDKRLIATTVSTLLRAAGNGAPDLYPEHAARWLAAHLVWAHNGRFELGSDHRKPGIITDPRLARVIEYASVYYGRQLSTAQLAHEAGVSPFHFERLFREATGLTPHAYLTEIRMAAAQRLLTTTDLLVADIATACGYIRPTAFTAAFTSRFGEAPRAFRSRVNGKASFLRNPTN